MQTDFTHALQQIGVGLMAEFFEDSTLLLEESLDTMNTVVYFLQINVSQFLLSEIPIPYIRMDRTQHSLKRVSMQCSCRHRYAP